MQSNCKNRIIGNSNAAGQLVYEAHPPYTPNSGTILTQLVRSTNVNSMMSSVVGDVGVGVRSQMQVGQERKNLAKDLGAYIYALLW